MRPHVVSMSFVGSNLRGRSGWTNVILSDGTVLRLGEMGARRAIETVVAAGIDCTDYSARMDYWVANGRMPSKPDLPEKLSQPVSLAQYAKSAIR